MPKKAAVASLDPRSADVVLEFIEGSRPIAGVPARDLHAGDLARIAYVRELRKRVELGPRDPDNVRPSVDELDLAAIRDGLLESGVYVPAGTGPAASEPAGGEPAPSIETGPADPAVIAEA